MTQNKEALALADQCAKQNGYFATIFCGTYYGEGYYLPLRNDDRNNDGMACYVVVIDGKVHIEKDVNEVFNIYQRIINRSVDLTARGVTAYKKIIDKYNKGKLSKEEEEYVRQLQEMMPLNEVGTIVEPTINPINFFLYFEMAQRYNKHLALFPDEEGNPVRHIQIVD